LINGVYIIIEYCNSSFFECIVADFSAQAIVNTYLKDHFPEDPIVGEEDSKDLQGDVGKTLREKVFTLTNGVLGDNEKLSEQQVSSILFVGRGWEEKAKRSPTYSNFL
jgi:3'-phosphoadenosine 5'-phosphosulfate (PAPS) 3'-phosphatase